MNKYLNLICAYYYYTNVLQIERNETISNLPLFELVLSLAALKLLIVSAPGLQKTFMRSYSEPLYML